MQKISKRSTSHVHEIDICQHSSLETVQEKLPLVSYPLIQNFPNSHIERSKNTFIAQTLFHLPSLSYEAIPPCTYLVFHPLPTPTCEKTKGTRKVRYSTLVPEKESILLMPNNKFRARFLVENVERNGSVVCIPIH